MKKDPNYRTHPDNITLAFKVLGVILTLGIPYLVLSAINLRNQLTNEKRRTDSDHMFKKGIYHSMPPAP